MQSIKLLSAEWLPERGGQERRCAVFRQFFEKEKRAAKAEVEGAQTASLDFSLPGRRVRFGLIWSFLCFGFSLDERAV